MWRKASHFVGIGFGFSLMLCGCAADSQPAERVTYEQGKAFYSSSVPFILDWARGYVAEHQLQWGQVRRIVYKENTGSLVYFDPPAGGEGADIPHVLVIEGWQQIRRATPKDLSAL